jgi:hypothetical protein
MDRLVRRVRVGELAERLNTQGEDPIVIADVRSHGYYDAGAQRVRGSIRLEPNNMEPALDALPKNAPIFLYCT